MYSYVLYKMKSIQIWVNHFFYGLWNSWITKEIKQQPNIRPAINDVLDIINPWAKRTTKRHISNDSRQHSDTDRYTYYGYSYVAFNFIQRKDENEIENEINKVNCINICTSLTNEVSNRKAIRLVDVGWLIRRHPSTMKSWRHYPVERKRQSTDVQLIVDQFLFRVVWLDEPVHDYSIDALITPINSSYLFEIFRLTVAT